MCVKYNRFLNSKLVPRDVYRHTSKATFLKMFVFVKISWMQFSLKIALPFCSLTILYTKYFVVFPLELKLNV